MKITATVSLLFILLFQFLNAQETEKEEKFIDKLTFGGRIMYDFNKIDHYDEDISFTGSEFRRARIELSGEVAKNIGFLFQTEFAKGVVRFKAMNIYFNDLPKIGGKLSIGNIHEPFSLDQLTSSKYITFIERATPTELILKWRLGFLYENFNLFKGRMGLQMAYTLNGTNPGGVNFKIEDGRNLSLRATGIVIDDKDSRQTLHLGASFSHAKPIKINENPEREFIIAVRPEAHMANVSLFHVFEDAENAKVTGFEAAYTLGPFSIQGEFVHANVATKSENFSVPSYYAYISYFITGEHRPYKYGENVFARVKPIKDFNFKDKWGAVELAARYSSFDLSDAEQGKLNNITLGVNWYLNPRTRIMYNYILSDDQSPEKANIHLLRFQIDFGKTFK